jgi:hypothetical protein
MEIFHRSKTKHVSRYQDQNILRRTELIQVNMLIHNPSYKTILTLRKK